MIFIDKILANKNYLIGGVLIIAVACYLMFSGGIPDIGSGIDKARTELSAVRAELDTANRQLSESQSIVDELKRTNSDLTNEIAESRAVIDTLRQTNSDITSEIDRGSVLNQSNLNIVRDSQQGLKGVREAGQR